MNVEGKHLIVYLKTVHSSISIIRTTMMCNHQLYSLITYHVPTVGTITAHSALDNLNKLNQIQTELFHYYHYFSCFISVYLFDLL